ncbi:MAG TPA: right-handed parallel beta-helix repeat-containing protein [Polyangiaceae bacterium]|nr:right-handed parallel beta-helix repeat-containing protein [Polyangiaceae bacterium]
MKFRGNQWVFAGSVVFLLWACGGDSGSAEARGGSGPVEGGRRATGGAGGSSGAHRGGATSRGGEAAMGGAQELGGEAGACASGSCGGSDNSEGGAQPTGGQSSAEGGSSGGTSVTGGRSSAGGTTDPGTAGRDGVSGASAGMGGQNGGGEIFVDPSSGSDDAAGTREAPLQTIEKASALAVTRGSDAIRLLDGTYDATTERKFRAAPSSTCDADSGLVLPSGIELTADHPGKAELIVTSGSGLCLSGARVSGLRLSRAALGGAVLSMDAGTVEIEETTFSNCGYPGISGFVSADALSACVVARGTAEVSLVPSSQEPVWRWGTVGTWIVALDSSVVSVGSGIVEANSSAGSLFVAAGDSKLTISGVQATSNVNTIAMETQDRAEIAAQHGKVTGFGVGLYTQSESTKATLEDWMFAETTTAVYLTGSKKEQTTVQLRAVEITGSQRAVVVNNCEAALTIEDSTLRNNAIGVLFSGSGQLTLRDSRVEGGDRGVRAFAASGTYSVTLRNTVIAQNKIVGLSLEGALLGTYDLGTVGSPGGNTLVGNASEAATPSNLVVIGTGNPTVQAVGNTWEKSLQGADANGQYVITGAGEKLEVQNGTGPNYVLGEGVKLRLAENP